MLLPFKDAKPAAQAKHCQAKRSSIKATLHRQAKHRPSKAPSKQLCTVKRSEAPSRVLLPPPPNRSPSKRSAIKGHRPARHPSNSITPPSKAPPSANGAPIKQSAPRVRATELLGALASNSDKVLFNGYTFRPTKRAGVRQFLTPARSARWGCRSVCHSASQA